MKKSIHLLGLCLAIIIALFSFSCKKDIAPVNVKDAPLTANDHASVEIAKSPDFIVYSEGPIQAMVDAARPAAVSLHL